MRESTSPLSARRDRQLLILLSAFTVLIHLLYSSGYGYFRDELYAIACSKHLAWGYVDQPPFSEVVLAIVGRTLGYSQFALRLLPALCGGVVTFLVGVTAKRLGGGRAAQVLAATAYIVGGVFLAIAGYYSMNCFDHLFWALGIYILVLILQGGDTRLWLLFGLVAGLGLENKYSMGFFGLGLVVGLALTPARKHFLDKWLWVGGALAAAMFLPHVLWEVHHHFPTAEFVRNATLRKNLPMTPWQFLVQSMLMVNPVTLPIWLAGLIYLFSPGGEPAVKASGGGDAEPAGGLRKSNRALACLGWSYLAVLAILLTTNSKPYYFVPAFLLLFPAGGVAIESFVARHKWNLFIPAYLAVMVLAGAAFAPMVVPILPPETLIRYQKALGTRASSGERGEKSLRLSQIFADRFGWPEMTAQVAEIYNRLSPEEKAECVIGASNYGEAGAIDFFGKRYGLPGAISTHNNYWYWGPGDKPGTILLVINGSRKNYEALYNDVQQVATFTHPYAAENNIPIFLCRNPKHTLQEYWPKHHNFI